MFTMNHWVQQVIELFDALGLEGVEIGSAGISAMEGSMASKGARAAMAAMGLSLEAHRSRQVTSQLAEEADLILTMTHAHAVALGRMTHHPRVYTLYEYVGEIGDVQDPFGSPDHVYEECARRMQPRIGRAIQRIQAEENDR